LASIAHRVVRGLVGGCALLLGVTLTGCATQFTYVANTSQHAYFKVPSDWHKIGSAALAAQLNANGTVDWLIGYEPGGKPTANDFNSVRTSRPFVFADVGPLNSTVVNELSYNTLRDIILPVTDTARSNAAAQGSTLSGFQQIRDQMISSGQGVHGVRETYQYTFSGVSDTFDQIALTNANQTILYLLYVHCTSSCFRHNQAAINEIMSSFTVRSP
jgi:hypothetical protein